MPVKRIVIAGGGVAGWLAAAALARKTRCRVLVLEHGGRDDSLGIPMPIEATLPSAIELHQRLGLDEPNLHRASAASFSLGRAISGWRTGAPAFHPYGETGAPLGPISFHHLAQRLRADGQMINFANYALAALCAQTERFARPAGDPHSVLWTMDFGLHVETAGYRDALKSDAMLHGATTVDGKVASLDLDDSGLIDAIMLEGGQRVEGDLFLDCGGPTASLIGKIPGSSFDDWSHWLRCDAALICAAPQDTPPLPYVAVAAHPAGWRSTMGTRSRSSEVVLCARAEVAKFDGTPYPVAQGRQSSLWRGNCLAIGGAAAVIDPVACTQLHLAGKAISRLLSLFPRDRACAIEAAEYNRQTGEELENVRDFAILHYFANGRVGDPFWDDCRTMEIPDRLAYRIALYKSVGRIAQYDEESFEPSDWIAMFEAMGVQPRRHDIMADALPAARIADHFAQIRAVMLKAVAALPSHAEYIGMPPV